MITSAKALGGGLPAGAVVISPELGDGLEAGDHGSTFAGGPMTATAALTALELAADPSLLARVRALGERFRDGLFALDGIAEVRGRGLMVGVGLEDGIDAGAVAARALAAGLVINVPGAGMLRFLPPLVIDEADVDEALELLGEALA